MSRSGTTLTAVALALAGSVALGAQTSTGSPVVSPNQQAPAAPIATGPVTFTGCLKSWVDGSGAPAASPAAARRGDARYTLTQVDVDSQSAPVVTAGQPAQKKEDLRFILTGGPTVNMAGSINKKVRVTGTVVPDEPVTDAPVGTSGRATNKAGYATASAPEEAHPYKTLEVSAITMVDDACGI